MGADKEIKNFLKEIYRVTSKFGSQKVLSQVRKLYLETDNKFTEEVCNYILLITSNKYKIEKNVLMFSNKRGTVTIARRMCYALMKEHLVITDEEIGKYFGGKQRQYINNQLMSLPINQDVFNNKDDEKFMQDFLELTTDVLYFINSYDINYKNNE